MCFGGQQKNVKSFATSLIISGLINSEMVQVDIDTGIQTDWYVVDNEDVNVLMSLPIRYDCLKSIISL